MDLIKEYIDKLSKVKESGVDADKVKEVRSLLDSSKEELTARVNEVIGNAKELKEEELRDSLDTTYELKDLIAVVEDLLNILEEQLVEENKGGNDEEEEVEEVEEVEEGKEEEERKEKKEEKDGVKESEVRSSKLDNERGVKDMKLEEIKNKNNKLGEERSAFVKFLQTRSITDGVKTTDAEVVIPESVKAEVDIELEEGLAGLVTTVPVTSPAGRFPIVESGKKVLPRVEELVESPQLGLFKVRNVTYDTQTHRAYTPISYESIDDAEYVLSSAMTIIKHAGTDTKNSEVLRVLSESEDIKTANIKDISDFITLDIESKYSKGFVISKSKYNEIARLKDSEGRYYLHNDLTQPVGKTILGYPVEVFDDEIVGEDAAYFGDFKSAVVIFLLKELTVTWDAWMNYGKCLSPIIRLDTQLVEPKALIKLNFDDALEGETP